MYQGLLQQALFCCFLVTTVMSVLIAISLPVLLPATINSCKPADRRTLLTGLTLLPFCAGWLVVFLAMVPSLLQLAGISNDHCLGHEEGHIHFCLLHLPVVIDSWWVWGPALGYAALLAVVALYLLSDLVAITRFQVKLAAVQQMDGMPFGRQTTVLDVSTPLALSCGLFWPRIYLSSGLSSSLSRPELDLVLAHEHEHIRSKDALRSFLGRGFGLLHLPAARQRLLQQLNLACEQACDEQAAVLDSKTSMAALLLKLERLYATHFPVTNPLAPAVTGAGNLLEARVRSLLAGTGNKWLATRHLLLSLTTLLLLVCAGYDAFHEILEHLVSWLAGAH